MGASTLDSMSERELERLYAGLLKLATLPDEELRALVGSALAGTVESSIRYESGVPNPSGGVPPRS